MAQIVAPRELTPHMRRIMVGGPEVMAFLRVDGVDVPAAWVAVSRVLVSNRLKRCSILTFLTGCLYENEQKH